MNQERAVRGSSFFVVGGAGFIGSYFVDHLLSRGASRITVYDNFSSGKRWHLDQHEDDQRLTVVVGDARDLGSLAKEMVGHDVVIHLASNPDIARALIEPRVDFDGGTVLTFNVLESMRESGTQVILYASGSGVYGDLGELEVDEDHGPLTPISTYGASKLAGEAMIAAYCAMFDLESVVFRFANVVGSRQTHGVGFDFLRKLRADPTRLEILGDGSQSKSYVHVDDVVAAVLLSFERTSDRYSVFNVGTDDHVTVLEIAHLAMKALGLDPGEVTQDFTGGDRGWKGDIPVVRLGTKRIRAMGWSNDLTSAEAIAESLTGMLNNAERVFDER